MVVVDFGQGGEEVGVGAHAPVVWLLGGGGEVLHVPRPEGGSQESGETNPREHKLFH